MKDINAENLDPTKIGLQILGYQKSAFENFYSLMVQIQQQTEKMVEPLLKNTPGIPEGWKEQLKKNQAEMKKAIDDGFAKAESYYSASSQTKKGKAAAASTTQAKAEPQPK